MHPNSNVDEPISVDGFMEYMKDDCGFDEEQFENCYLDDKAYGPYLYEDYADDTIYILSAPYEYVMSTLRMRHARTVVQPGLGDVSFILVYNEATNKVLSTDWYKGWYFKWDTKEELQTFLDDLATRFRKNL